MSASNTQSPSKTQYTGPLSPEFALLGLLAIKPAHGYDLYQQLITDLGQVWHLSQSQAYAILKRLETRGDIFGIVLRREVLCRRDRPRLPPQPPLCAVLQVAATGRARSPTHGPGCPRARRRPP